MQSFNRIEEKYLLSEVQYKYLIKRLQSKINKDSYFKSNISNIYFDTPNFDVINSSLDKPTYKEKVRIRSYTKVTGTSALYLEVKKKYNGIVNKRRIETNYQALNNYINQSVPINDSQIFKEIDYTIKNNTLSPKIYIAYDRNSYYLKSDPNFRITFDKNLRYRLKKLDLKEKSAKMLFDDNYYIMEIKTFNAIPIWLCQTLESMNIYPISFSKYGEIYKKVKGGKLC